MHLTRKRLHGDPVSAIGEELRSRLPAHDVDSEFTGIYHRPATDDSTFVVGWKGDGILCRQQLDTGSA